MSSVSPLNSPAAAGAGVTPAVAQKPLITTTGVNLSADELLFCKNTILKALEAPSLQSLEAEGKAIFALESPIKENLQKAKESLKAEQLRFQNEIKKKETSLISLKTAVDDSKKKLDAQTVRIDKKYKELNKAILDSIKDNPPEQKQRLAKIRDDLLKEVAELTKNKESLETAYLEEEKKYKVTQVALKTAIANDQAAITKIEADIKALDSKAQADLANFTTRKNAFIAKNSGELSKVRSLKALFNLFNLSCKPANVIKEPTQLKVAAEVFEEAKKLIQADIKRIEEAFASFEKAVKEKISAGDFSAASPELGALIAQRDLLSAKTSEHDTAKRQLGDINTQLEAQLTAIAQVSADWKKVVDNAQAQDSERFEQTSAAIIALGKRQFDHSKTISRCKSEKEEAERSFQAQKIKYMDSVINSSKAVMQNQKTALKTNHQSLIKGLEALQALAGVIKQPPKQNGSPVVVPFKPIQASVVPPPSSSGKVAAKPPTSKKRTSTDADLNGTAAASKSPTPPSASGAVLNNLFAPLHNPAKLTPAQLPLPARVATAASAASASLPAAMSSEEAARIAQRTSPLAFFADTAASLKPVKEPVEAAAAAAVGPSKKRVKKTSSKDPKLANILEQRKLFRGIGYDATKFPKGSFHEHLVNLSDDNFTFGNIEKYLATKKKEELAELFKVKGNRAALHIIAERSNPEVLGAFLNKYSNELDFTEKTKEGQNALTFIAQNAAMNTKAIGPLIKTFKGKLADMEACSQTVMTPLNIACYYGYLEIVQALIFHGASSKMVYGLDPIRSSVLAGREDIETFKWLACNVIKTKNNMEIYTMPTDQKGLHRLVEDDSKIYRVVNKLVNLKKIITPEDKVFTA